jgi:hypothetical protein
LASGVHAERVVRRRIGVEPGEHEFVGAEEDIGAALVPRAS